MLSVDLIPCEVWFISSVKWAEIYLQQQQQQQRQQQLRQQRRQQQQQWQQ